MPGMAGRELNIYLELSGDDEYAAQKQSARRSPEPVRAAWS